MPKIYIQDLHPGEQFQSIFALVQKNIRTTRSGEPYLSVLLADKTGSLGAKMWWRSGSEEQWDACQQGDIVQVDGLVEEFQGQRQLKIEHIMPYKSEYAKDDFLPTIENIDELWQQLQKSIASIQTEYLKDLLSHYFEDEYFVAHFKIAPAAKQWHDNKLGGLLKHTLNVALLCQHVVEQYPGLGIDRDLLITAAILHDSGKIEEYATSGTTIEKTDQGRLVGHTNIALMRMSKKIEEINDFPLTMRDHLLHLIISHHGYQEYGAAVLPATVEAVILHCADMLDSMVVGISQQTQENGEPWLYSKILQRWIRIRDNNEKGKER